ncbi:MAG: Cation/acetate symporter ActP [candidate division BRC1 bacterium ADurb.BinA292]|nr:MAG: Cation/acetate symporter ActP [candidate division BRC1 bacterium ADurb.BinA292]
MTDLSAVQVWTYVLVTVTFMFYLYIGWWARVRESSGFYVAGRGVPAIANGAATAADWMSAASFISMAGLISVMGYDGSIYLMGWTGGYVLLALLLAPYLRKFGKYTVPDFVGDRYYSDTARVVAVIAALFISMTYVAGQMRGVGIVFSRFLEVPINVGVVIGMVIVAFFAVLGGMKGITWTQVAQYGVLILAFLIPSSALALKLTGQPIPQLAFVFSDLTEKLNQIQVDLGFKEYTEPFRDKSLLDVLCITVALMVGTAGLPHVIVRFYTVPNVRAARWSAGWALLFIALLYTTAPALATFARYNLLASLNGKTIEEIEQLEWVASWEKTQLLKYVDKNGDGRIQIAPGDAFLRTDGDLNLAQPNPATANEVYFSADIIVLSTPEVARLPAWVIALVAAGGLAAALSTASGLLLVISSSIAHDIYYRLIRPTASEGQRVMVGRICVVLAVIVAGYFGINPMGFVAQVVAFAFGLAAASFFPIIILGIFDSRTNRTGAIWGMIVGLSFVVIYITGTQAHKIFGTDQPWFGNWFFGISAEGIGAVGMVLNVVVTLVVSRLTAAPPRAIREMVESIRHPDHPAPALILDEESE